VQNDGYVIHQKQFGKQIQSQQFTEWSPYYLDYKGLKKFISSLLNTPADSLKALGLPPIGIEEDRAKLLQSQKAAFFFKLERELEKVDIFDPFLPSPPLLCVLFSHHVYMYTLTHI